MSIGARAAIYEQTHHVNKYGLDGDKGNNNTDNTSSSPTKSTTQSTSDEWERLMDGVPCNTSIIADSHVSASFSYHKNNNSYAMDTTYENQSDYFNSSTIMKNLATPEKNKKTVDEASRLARLGIGMDVRGGGDGDGFGGMTSSRCHGNESMCHSESGSVSASGENTLEQSGMLGLFHAAMRLGEQSIREGGLGEEDAGDEVDDDDDDVAESFISYFEPNMSVVHLNQKPLMEESEMDFFHRGDRVHGDEEGDNFTDVQTDIDMQASFISYRDPDLSMISKHHDHESEGMNMRMISKANSEFGRSEFDVDVSEIIAPSDIGSKLPSANYSPPFGKYKPGRQPASPGGLVGNDNCTENIIFSPFGTPINSRGEQNEIGALTPPSTSQIASSEFLGQYQLEDEVGWPSTSPFMPQSSLTSAEETPDKDHTGNDDTSRQLFASSDPSDEPSPKINRSLGHQFDSWVNDESVGGIAENTILAAEICSWHKDLATAPPPAHQHFETPPSPPRKNRQDPVRLKTNISFLSPIENQCSSEETKRLNRGRGKEHPRSVKDQLKVYDSVSPLTTPNPKQAAQGIREILGEKCVIVHVSTKAQNTKCYIPQRISLRDRYSRPDRFEDSYSVPSSASTLHSSEASLSTDQSSALETFTNDCISPQEQKEFAARRFAV